MFADPKFWVAASFVVFFLLFGKMAWARVSAMLDARGERIRDELEEASRLRAEAEAMLAKAEAERAAALAEATQMLERAKSEAARLAAQTAAEAEASARRRERLAMDRIAAAEGAAVKEVREAAVEIATAAARDLIAARHDAAADAGMVDQAIGALPTAFRAA
jgi:F-type H+-transporting ATPase subunit b